MENSTKAFIVIIIIVVSVIWIVSWLLFNVISYIIPNEVVAISIVALLWIICICCTCNASVKVDQK